MTLTDPRDRHNLEVTEPAFGWNEGRRDHYPHPEERPLGRVSKDGPRLLPMAVCPSLRTAMRRSGNRTPQVERWYRTLQQRAAFRDHVMIPFEELRGRLID
jgi:hypothetical protein